MLSVSSTLEVLILGDPPIFEGGWPTNFTMVLFQYLENISGWWLSFNPSEQYYSKWESSPIFGVKIENIWNILKPPPRNCCSCSSTLPPPPKKQAIQLPSKKMVLFLCQPKTEPTISFNGNHFQGLRLSCTWESYAPQNLGVNVQQSNKIVISWWLQPIWKVL